MKMNLQGVDIELTPKELFEWQELLYGEKEPKDMTFDEELEFIQTLRHFKAIDFYWDENGKIFITLRSDIR